MLTAWVDESMRAAAEDASARYSPAAAVCDAAAASRCRDALLPLRRAGHKLHFRDLTRRQQRNVDAVVARLEVRHVVVHGQPLDHRRQERARAQTLQALIAELAPMHVGHVVLEARTPSLNARDEKLLARLRGSRLLPSGMRFDIEQPSTEPMLWAPDQVLGLIAGNWPLSLGERLTVHNVHLT